MKNCKPLDWIFFVLAFGMSSAYSWKEGDMMKYVLISFVAATIFAGCFSLKTEHKVEPIHITMDINLKVQRDLEEFLDVQD
jgi:hypothetical protein